MSVGHDTSGNAERTSVCPNNQNRSSACRGVATLRSQRAAAERRSCIVGAPSTVIDRKPPVPHSRRQSSSSSSHELGARASDSIDSSASVKGRDHPSRQTRPATRIGMRRREQDPEGTRVRTDQHHRPVAPHRVEHAPHVVDPVLERREPTVTVRQAFAALVHHDQAGEARHPLDDLPVPRKFLAHPDVADHRRHHEDVDGTVAVDGIRDVEAVALGVTKPRPHHRRRLSTPPRPPRAYASHVARNSSPEPSPPKSEAQGERLGSIASGACVAS